MNDLEIDLKYRPVSPRRVLLDAPLGDLVPRLATCGKTQNDVLLHLYRATPRIALWEISLVRRAPGVPTPNCLFLAEAVDAAHTSFTIVPFRHTYPDVPSQTAWNWCCNFFLAWRWLNYKQTFPFPLNEQGKYQFTRDDELRDFLHRPPLSAAQFKQQRRLDYYNVLSGAELDLQINAEWERYQSMHQLRLAQARAELQARALGESITFDSAAQELLTLLEPSIPP